MQPRIIILEDDEDVRALLTLLLQKYGYEVVSAPEPLMCPLYIDLDTACDHAYPCGDFLLSDNRMPRMTGLQFVHRQHQRGCKGAIRNKALISGTWDAEELELARQLGCKVFTKPCRFEDILTWLKNGERTLDPRRKLTGLD